MKLGTALYFIGIALLILTLAIPLVPGLLYGAEAATAYGIFSMFTFWPGLFFFFVGRSLRKPEVSVNGDTSKKSHKILRVLGTFLVVWIALMILSNLLRQFGTL